MTISKKLYVGFGAILAIMLFLFIINIFTVVTSAMKTGPTRVSQNFSSS